MRLLALFIILLFCLPIIADDQGRNKVRDHDRDHYRDHSRGRGHERSKVIIIEKGKKYHHRYYKEEYREGRPVIVERRTEVYREEEPDPTIKITVPIPVPPTIIIKPSRR